MWNVHEPGTSRMPRPRRNRQPIGGPHRQTVLPRLRFGSAALTAGLVVLGGLLHAIPVQAIEIGEGEFQGSLDTTISHGMTFRVEKRNAGLAADTNGNDGDLNYNRGIVSNTSKFTTDLDVGSGDFGAFVRATGFIDFENQNGTRERTPLSEAAKDKVGKISKCSTPTSPERSTPEIRLSTCGSAGTCSTGARAPSSRTGSMQSTTST